MGPGERTERGGRYVRVVGQTWRDPLDASHSKARGGRWNAPNSFGVIYLSRTLRLARLYVIHKLVGLPYGVEDLDPAAQDDLVELNVETVSVIDLISASGLTAVDLPGSYPRAADRTQIPWERCQPIGQSAYESDADGLVCRSTTASAAADDEELALFDRSARRMQVTARRPFDAWFFL